MTQGIKFDRQKLHQDMWDARDRNGKLQIFQKEWAKTHDITHFVMCRVMKDFEDEGRIKKIGARYRNVGIYVIYDPADFS